MEIILIYLALNLNLVIAHLSTLFADLLLDSKNGINLFITAIAINRTEFIINGALKPFIIADGVQMNSGQWLVVLRLFIVIMKIGIIKNKLSSRQTVHNLEIGPNINVLKINMQPEYLRNLGGNLIQILD